MKTSSRHVFILWLNHPYIYVVHNAKLLRSCRARRCQAPTRGTSSRYIFILRPNCLGKITNMTRCRYTMSLIWSAVGQLTEDQPLLIMMAASCVMEHIFPTHLRPQSAEYVRLFIQSSTSGQTYLCWGVGLILVFGISGFRRRNAQDVTGLDTQRKEIFAKNSTPHLVFVSSRPKN